MKVEVTYENGEVFQHFGRTPAFKVYDVEDGEIKSSEVLATGDSGHGALAGFLDNAGAKVLICGGIGGGAVNAMNAAGIKIYAGASGNTDDVVKQYIDGTLPEAGDATCDHHGHNHDGDCGHDHCAEHDCEGN